MESWIDKIMLNIADFEKKFVEFYTPTIPVITGDTTKSGAAIKPLEESKELGETKVELFLQDADISAIEIVRLLCCSLLSGQYVYDENLKNSLNVIEDKVKDFIKITDYLPINIQKKIFDYLSCVTIVIEGYKIFVQNISNKYSIDRIDFIFSENNHLENVIKESNLSEKLDNISDYFLFLLDVTFIDHFPSNEDEYITTVFNLERKITSLKVQEYNDLTKNILVKIKFLQHKWKERKVSEAPNSHLYLSDGNIRVVENFKEENEKLKDWCDIIETQYELISKNWVHILEKRIKPYKEKNLNDLKILEIHQLIKYYKDVKPNYDKLVEISKHLNKRDETSLNVYNKYAKIISVNYSLNNCFSLFLHQNKDLDIVKYEYLKVKNKIKGGVYNFFLEYKYLNFITEFLLDKINVDDKIKYIEKYDDIIKSHCKTEIEAYFSNKEWAKWNFNYIFILPFEECLVPCTNIEDLNNIFYASSFVLPPYNNKIENDYTKIKEDYEKINLLVNTGKYFKKEIEKIEVLNKELEKKDFKSIEIISIFTAIITFVLSSIPSYKFVNSVWDSLLFMLTLSASLGIFVMLILFSTRGFKNNSRGVFFALFLFIIALMGYNCLIGYEQKKVIITNIDNIKIDSILKIKSDSLFKAHPIKK